MKNKIDCCKCEIKDPEKECYRGKKEYWLATPEEAPAFGRMTKTIHIACKKPVDSERVLKWVRKYPYLWVPEKWEIELK